MSIAEGLEHFSFAEKMEADPSRNGARFERYRLIFKISERTSAYQNDEVSEYQRFLIKFFSKRAVKISKPRFFYSPSGQCYVSFLIAGTNVGARIGKTYLFDERAEDFKEIAEVDLPRYGLSQIQKTYSPGAVLARENVNLRKRLALRKREGR